MSRTPIRILAVALLFHLAAGCANDLVGPDASSGDPQLLIGNSPLAPISLDRSTDLPTLRVPVEVGKNGAAVGDLDQLFLHSTVGIWDVTDKQLSLGKVSSNHVVDARTEAALREGDDVLVTPSVGLGDIWFRIEAKREVRVVATVELVRVSSSGSRRTLDAMTREGTVQPSEAK